MKIIKNGLTIIMACTLICCPISINSNDNVFSKSNTPVTTSVKQQNNAYYPVVVDNNHIGFMDKYGKIVKTSYYFSYLFDQNLQLKEELFPFADSSYRIGFMDHSGKVVIKPQFTNAFSFSEGIASGTLDGMLCFFDKAGKILIKTDYTNASYYSEGLCVVSKNGLYGVINSSGKVIVELQYKFIYDFNNGMAIAIDKDNYKLYINNVGKVVWKSAKPIAQEVNY